MGNVNDSCRRFSGKTIIISGAAGGIGLATAKRMASEGGKVVIADLDLKKCAIAEKEVLAAGAEDVLSVACDVANEVQVKNCVAQTLDRFGRLDVIVNNAGLMVFKSLEEHTIGDWQRILNVDLLGAFLFTREAFFHMKDGGAIVNVSSIHAVETTPHVASYAAAKAALLSLTRSASIEGKSKKIRVNAVLPGAIDTPMLWENPNIKAGLEVINKRDVGKAEEVAAAIAFLASSDASFVQGESLVADGGRISRL